MQYYTVSLSILLLVASITYAMHREERFAEQEASTQPFLIPESQVHLDRPCADNNYYCSQWKGLGECEKNGAWMKINCKMSCKQCGDLNECVDHNENCEAWANSGQCKSNPVYMLLYCEKACRVGQC